MEEERHDYDGSDNPMPVQEGEGEEVDREDGSGLLWAAADVSGGRRTCPTAWRGVDLGFAQKFRGVVFK